MDMHRRLVFDFFRLPYGRRLEVMRAFRLIDPADDRIPEDARYAAWFRRAQDRGLIMGIRDAIDSRLDPAE